MSQLHIDDVVRLKYDLPELSLNRGVLGVVRSTWFEPSTRYEVEFTCDDRVEHPRALVGREAVELQNDAGLLSVS